MVELVGKFYRPVKPIKARQLYRGQICWSPILYLSPRLQTVSIRSHSPRHELLNELSISTHAPDDFSVFDHPPVHELRLQNDEALVVNKAKRRPVIVMSQRNTPWQMAGARLSERGLVCLPMYSFHPQDSREFRNRIRAQEYPWWLYLPEHTTFREGFARLDRLQTIEESHLQPALHALSDDALWFVSQWLRYYLTEEIDDFLLDYRRELIQSLTNG